MGPWFVDLMRVISPKADIFRLVLKEIEREEAVRAKKRKHKQKQKQNEHPQAPETATKPAETQKLEEQTASTKDAFF